MNSNLAASGTYRFTLLLDISTADSRNLKKVLKDVQETNCYKQYEDYLVRCVLKL